MVSLLEVCIATILLFYSSSFWSEKQFPAVHNLTRINIDWLYEFKSTNKSYIFAQ